jgi:hypothetical protein
MSERYSEEQVSKVLDRLLIQGWLSRIPRNPAHRDIVLAVLCRKMRRRYPYTEREFNDYLRDALAEVRARVDHVTCRRYMVDFGFVKRDRAGNRYILNFPRLEATLADGVLEDAGKLIGDALGRARKPTGESPKQIG